MSVSPPNSGDFLFLGGLLWLDFVNTEKIGQSGRLDLLSEPQDLVRWLVAAGLPADTEASGELLREAKAFRAALRELAEALAAGHSAPEHSIASINAMLSARSGHFALVNRDGSYAREFVSDRQGLRTLLGVVAESAAGLLSEGDPSLVRRCGNPSCILFFYDSTKNHGRRFCSASGCGNRMKVAAHYRRKRLGQGSASAEEEDGRRSE